MKILVADDEPMQLRVAEVTLRQHGFEPLLVRNGDDAADALSARDAPTIAILDWNMPGLTGAEVCSEIRARRAERYQYLILLTNRLSVDDRVMGFDCGADDFISKPFEPREMVARIRVGERILRLQSKLADRIDELQRAKTQIGELEGLLPVCMHCARVRSDAKTWERIESYIEQRCSARFSHGLCETCLDRHHPAETAS